MDEDKFQNVVPSFAYWKQNHGNEAKFSEVRELVEKIVTGYDLSNDEWQEVDEIFSNNSTAESAVEQLKMLLNEAVDDNIPEDIVITDAPILAQSWFQTFIRNHKESERGLFTTARRLDEALGKVPDETRTVARQQLYQHIFQACEQNNTAYVVKVIEEAVSFVQTYILKEEKDETVSHTRPIDVKSQPVGSAPKIRLMSQRIGPVPVWVLALILIFLVIGGLVALLFWPESEPEVVALPFGGAYPVVGATEVIGEVGQKLPDFAPELATEAAILPTDTPEPTRTPEPTATPETPKTFVGDACPGGYYGWRTFPNADVVGEGQGWENLDFSADPEGPALEERQYFVLPINDRPEKVLVVMEGGSYFMPAAWFPLAEKQKECLAAEDLKSVQAAFTGLEARGSFASSIWSGEFWTSVVGVLIVLVIGVQNIEFWYGKAYTAIVILPLTFGLVMYAEQGIDREHAWSLFVIGLMVTLALGIWFNRKLVEDVVREVIPSGQIPRKIEALFTPGFIQSVNWSPSAVWSTMMIAAELVFRNGSPLRSLGQTWTLVVSGFFMMLFYALDAVKRGSARDSVMMVISIVLAFAAGVVTSIVKAGSSIQIISYLVIFAIGVVLISLMTRQKDETEYSRLLDNLGFFFAAMLWVIALTVRLGLVFVLL